MITKLLPITNCIDCPHHKVEPEPDPDYLDSFCHDDVKVVCVVVNKNVTVACRPHYIRAESRIPNWCPL